MGKKSTEACQRTFTFIFDYEATKKRRLKVRAKERYELNKVQIAIDRAARYQENRIAVLASQREYSNRPGNRERAALRTLAWQKKNPEKANAKAAAWKKANRPKVRASQGTYNHDWRVENPGYHALYRKTKPDVAKGAEERRLRRVKATGGKLSKGLVPLLMSEQGCRCAYCSCDLLVSDYHLDHYFPIARGGANEDWNIQLTCPPCNRRKRDRDPMEFFNEAFPL